MGKALRILFPGFIFLLFAGHGFAQQTEDCDLSLSHSESEFNAGHFYGIPSILNECLSTNGFTKEQKVRAYLLLSQVYLIIDDPIAAEDSYLKLLKVDPEYVANEARDPIDVVFLSKKFTSTPIFTPHFRAGLNTSVFRSIYTNSTQPYPVTAESSPRFGAQVGGGIDWNITDNISLCIEADFGTKGYERVRSGIGFNDVQTVISNQTWFDAPLYFKYSDNRDKRIRPFGYLGIAGSLLINATNSFSLNDSKPNGSQLITEGATENVSYQHIKLNRSWLIGGGVKYKIGKNFLFADLRYMGGLSNITNENTVYYSDPSKVDKSSLGNPNYVLSNNVTRYLYTSDLFRLDNISLSFGYIVPIYNPRKIKVAKTKSLSRKIKRRNNSSSSEEDSSK